MTTCFFVNCDPDAPKNFTASRDENEARIQSTYGGYYQPKELSIDDADDAECLVLGLWSDCECDTLNELLCGCWALAHYAAAVEFLIAEGRLTEVAKEVNDFEPFPAAWFRGSDFSRHGNLFCEMVGVACGADAEATQRAEFGDALGVTE